MTLTDLASLKFVFPRPAVAVSGSISLLRSGQTEKNQRAQAQEGQVLGAVSRAVFELAQEDYSTLYHKGARHPESPEGTPGSCPGDGVPTPRRSRTRGFLQVAKRRGPDGRKRPTPALLIAGKRTPSASAWIFEAGLRTSLAPYLRSRLPRLPRCTRGRAGASRGARRSVHPLDGGARSAARRTSSSPSAQPPTASGTKTLTGRLRR